MDLKKYRTEYICLIMALFVNALILLSVINGDTVPAPGMESRGSSLLLLAFADLAVLAVCWLYRRWVARRHPLAGTVVLVALSPAVSMAVLETLTGNLTVLPRAAIVINLMIAYAVLAVFLLFFQKIRTAVMFCSALFLLLGLVQHYVLRFRGRSFMLTDITSAWTALQVAGGYSYELGLAAGCAVLVSVGWLYLAAVTPTWRLRKFLIIRKIGVVLLCVFCLRLLGDRTFASQHNVLQMDMWNTEKDYRTKGYLLNLLAQVQYLTVEKPQNYSRSRVREIAEKYSGEYDAQTAPEAAGVLPVNLIVIMNESWTDFRPFAGYHYAETVTPWIDQMEENTTKGWIRVPAFGGGTASTEYEVLTGNSVELLEENPPVAYQVHSQPNEYGLASTLAAQGWHTLALHPHAALNYNRRQVYPRMRFDEFISKETWPEEFQQKVHKFISDQSCYDYLESIFEQKAEDEKLFTFLVTMQNHAGYTVKKYKSTVKLDYGQEYPQAEQYLSLIKESDAAFENLIRYFEGTEEPTMIVMFGDHWPNLQDDFYNTVFENGWAGITADENRRRFYTPFVMWTNYERESERDIVMSANYFGSYILQQMGARLSGYNKMLLRLREQMPVISGAEIMLADGSWYPRTALPEAEGATLNEYEIVQYNNMFAKGEKIDDIFTVH